MIVKENPTWRDLYNELYQNGLINAPVRNPSSRLAAGLARRVLLVQ
jgi:hypothetical protein